LEKEEKERGTERGLPKNVMGSKARVDVLFPKPLGRLSRWKNYMMETEGNNKNRIRSKVALGRESLEGGKTEEQEAHTSLEISHTTRRS